MCVTNGNSTTVQRERRHTKGLGLLFLVVCNSSAIFANRDWESFLFIVSGCFVYLFWIFKMSSSHSNSNVEHSLEIEVCWSLEGCTCVIMLLYHYISWKMVSKWQYNRLSQSFLGQFIIQQNLLSWQFYSQPIIGIFHQFSLHYSLHNLYGSHSAAPPFPCSPFTSLLPSGTAWSKVTLDDYVLCVHAGDSCGHRR